MAQTKIKSGQLDLSGAAHGTDGQALLSNADGTMRWGDIQVAGPGYTSLDYPGTTTALNAAGGQTLIINGSGYDANTTVTFGTTSVSAISVLSATQLSVTTPALANGTYDLVLGNDAGGTTTVSNVIIYNATPSWTTAAGSLGSVEKNATANFTVTATEPDGGTITYAVTSGALPTGLSLNTSSGAITGTATPSISSNTTYNFTITATDNENQTNARAFSIEVTVPLPSERFEVITYTGNGGTQKIEGGKILRGAEFNGSSSYIDINKKIPQSLNFSVSFWFQTTSTATDQYIFSTKGNSTTNGWWIISHSGTIRYGEGNGSANGTTQTSPASTYADGSWHHAVITRAAGGTVNMYIDGGQVITNGSIGSNYMTSYAWQYDLHIGRYAGSANYYYNGKLDQVRIFDKVLSSSEVTTLYQEDDYTSTTKSTTDIFNDNSGIALYEFEDNANATGNVSEIAFDSTINTSSIAYTVNNRKIAGNTGGSYASTRVTESKSSGKWYFEMYYNDSSYFPSSRSGLGLVCPTCTMSSYLGGTAQDDWAIFNGGNVRNNNSTVHNESLGDFSVGNVIMCALDLDNQKVYFGKNGTWFNSANPSNGTNGFTLSGSEYYAAGWVYNTSDQLTFRFREYDFSYTVPTGFSAYSETNYDGTASNVTFKEGTKFSPDLVWIKQRTGSTANPLLFDSVRGVHKQLMSSTTSATVDRTSADKGVTSFDSNGFTVKDTSAGDYEINGPNGGTYSGDGTYVAWCFNAGTGSSAQNSDGTITSTVKANQSAGFSIVKWTGNGTNGATIGHGLSNSPEIIITKGLSNSTSWVFGIGGVSGFGVNDYMTLQTTAAKSSTTTFYQAYSASTFQVGVSSANEMNKNSSNDYISYCFHSVAGYQKIGTYDGSGAAGNIVETGFEPAFLLIKNSSQANNEWNIIDNKRDTENPRNVTLWAHSSATESTASQSNIYDVNFLSNGFSVENTYNPFNASGQTYLYLAIAADPDITQPTQANSFNVVTYTGNASNNSVEVGFNGGLTWIKNRTDSNSYHILFDEVRGLNQVLHSNLTNAQQGSSNNFEYNNGTLSFDGSTTWANKSGSNYVAWVWKAADHDDSLPAANTTGTIDSVVSANQNAGFSIVKYKGTGSVGATFGHGLSAAPELIIWKENNVDDWMVVGKIGSSYQRSKLNTTDAFSTSISGVINDVDPTSTLVTLGNSGSTNSNGLDYIVYCFHSVTGHSKIGSYTGTAGANTIDVGFAPKFLMIKRADSTGSWRLYDRARDTGSLPQRIDYNLNANSDGAEYNASSETYAYAYFGTNGFYFVAGQTNADINASGGTYIYMAIK